MHIRKPDEQAERRLPVYRGVTTGLIKLYFSELFIYWLADLIG